MIVLRTFSVFVVSSLFLVLGCMETRDILATTESDGCGIPLAFRSPKKLHIVTVRGEHILGHYLKINDSISDAGPITLYRCLTATYVNDRSHDFSYPCHCGLSLP